VKDLLGIYYRNKTHGENDKECSKALTTNGHSPLRGFLSQ
jgi:hypothetical protein